MRRTVLLSLAAAAVLAVPATPASAAEESSGWEPTPSAPYDIPAGRLCDFPLHVEFPVDGVRGRTVGTSPDGTVQMEYVGPLVVHLTNTATGRSVDVNASARGLVDLRPDGTQLWRVDGPILFGFRPGAANNHEAGFFRLVGKYTVLVAPTGRTVLEASGTEENVCAAIA